MCVCASARLISCVGAMQSDIYSIHGILALLSAEFHLVQKIAILLYVSSVIWNFEMADFIQMHTIGFFDSDPCSASELLPSILNLPVCYA